MKTVDREKLWGEYQKNPSSALREKLITEYAPLVKVVAGRLSMYLGYNVEYEDLVSYGIFGLIDAIDKFDPGKDVKFETYASLRIRGSILDQIRKMDWIPRTVRQKQKRIEEAIKNIEARTGRAAAIQGLLLAQYEVLRENGHTPSEAFNETVEELTQSLMPLFAKNGMDWMYANCSTTAQRGALDWMTPFHDAIKPVVQKLYASVKSGNEAQISIDSNSQPDYREKLNEELRQLRESEMWQTAVTVRQLRPENN